MVKLDQGRLLTVPDEMPGAQGVLVTGNDFVSLPSISAQTGAIERFSVLHMGSASLLEICGSTKAGKEIGTQALILPRLELNGQILKLQGRLEWTWLDYFIPRFRWVSEKGEVELVGTYFAPLNEKGFVLLFSLSHQSGKPVSGRLGIEGNWGDSLQTVFRSGRIFGTQRVYRDRWTEGPVFELRAGLAMLGWAPMASCPMPPCSFGPVGSDLLPTTDEYHLPVGEALYFEWNKPFDLQEGQSLEMAFYVGVNREGDGARTTAIHLARRGFAELLEETRSWFKQRSKILNRVNPIEQEQLETVCNRNLFFNRFFSLGRTLDTEELCSVTSRSFRYYVSAAFWSRDALLWSLPGILLVDPKAAREVLINCFRRHASHFGIHSLYIDGKSLYPGFELDELCAFVLGLEYVLLFTNDNSLFSLAEIRDGLQEIESILWSKKHPAIMLFETELCPSDDPAQWPYLTYDNALVAKTFDCLDSWQARGWIGLRSVAANQGQAVRQAIFEHLTTEGVLGPMFAWSSDLGNPAQKEIYDEPPGSLSLLPYFGLCAEDHPIYQNTLKWIHSSHNPYSYHHAKYPGVGCPHAEHPFVMGLFNDLLSGREEAAKAVLKHARLDDDLACESYDGDTGQVKTGAAFATCAGFLAYSLVRAFGNFPCCQGESS